MNKPGREWYALSIRQPWIDMILDGRKTIEVREWRVPPIFRGQFLLHASRTIDWKTCALFNYSEPSFRHPRGALVGVGTLVDVIELSADGRWGELAMQHRVIHPPSLNGTAFGLILRNVRSLDEAVPLAGEQGFFVVEGKALDRICKQLGLPEGS